MNKYAIRVNGTREDVKRILTTLFSLGYVLTEEYRIKTWDAFVEIEKKWPPTYSLWSFIVTGNNSSCKAMLSVWQCIPDCDFKEITLEKFIKLNY